MPDAPQRYNRLNKSFQAALDLAPDERAAFLERECGGDPDLRREVEALLMADASEHFIEHPAGAGLKELLGEEAADLAGRKFGAYEIIREIGRGGLGAVFLAARADEEYRKEVAIKLVRRGLDTEDILRRFRNERQILAQLDHPNIARLIDGGTTDEGLPYFVMEYVEGEPIDRYSEARRLALQERLQLFRKVCAAVTYAHQNLVIHRDLKPSNILVTASGEPKLLDFGIAKVLTADDASLTLTVPEQRVLTRDYASPEQIRGERITTTSDVYSLGVLLYELLSGEKPYRLKEGTSEEISRAIAEQNPERPSTRQATGENRQSLRGDLDNIVLMAMRKEPSRRYASVEQLSEDIRRHLESRPIVARRDTFTYRAGKFVRRNKAGVLAAALILLAILGGMMATFRQSRLAHLEKARAERRFNDVRKLANSNLFEVYPEIENLEGSLKAREAILKNALTYLDSLAQEATGDSDLEGELATAYEKVGDVQGALNTSSLGKTKAALASYAKAKALRADVLEDNPKSIEAKDRLANNIYVTARTLWNNSQTAEAEKAFQDGIKLRRELIAAQPDSLAFQNQLALMLIDYSAIPAFNQQAEKASAIFDQAFTIIRRLRQGEPANVDLKKTLARGLRISSQTRTSLGDYAGGLAALDEARALSEELAREFPQDFRLQRSVWLTEDMTCELRIGQGKGAEAVASCEKTIAFPEAAFRSEPENGVIAYDLAISHFNLARALRIAREFPRAISEARRAVEVMSGLSAKAAENTEYKRNLAIYRTEMARCQLSLDQTDAALAALEDVRSILRPIVAADPTDTMYQNDLGIAQRLTAQGLHKKGDNTRAIEFAQKAIAIFERLRDQKSLAASDENVLTELKQERAEYASTR